MKAFISDLFKELDAFGRFWLALGLVVLVVAARMSWKFGYEVSLEHAAFLACLTVVAAFGPMAAEVLWGMGRKGVSIATAVICVPLLGIEFYSHAGYTAGLRGSNIETAAVQNMRFDGAQDAAKEDKANLEMWKDHLGKLMADNAWAATVKAEGLRAQLDAAQKAIDLEAARGGCKAKCLAEMNRKADLEKRIAIAERASDLTAKIEATQRILDKKRTVAATTEHKSSAVDHQNKFLIKSVAMVANGNLSATDLQAAGAEQSVNLAMAFAGTGLPAFCLFIAAMFRRRSGHGFMATAPAVSEHETAMPPRPAPVAHVEQPPRMISTNTITKVDGLVTTRSHVNPAMLIQQRVKAAA